MGQIKTLTALVLTVVFVQACIMEDRSNCPAYLTLDFSETPEKVSEIHLFIEDSKGYLFKDTLPANKFGIPYEIPVRRGELHIAAFGNIDRMMYDYGYRIHEGEDADSLYTCFISMACNDDLSFQHIIPVKNYIGLNIRIIGNISDSLGITVESTSVGYGLSGEIIEGIFRHSPNTTHLPSSEEAYFEFFSRVLRQKDESLSVTVRGTSDTILARVPLSAFLYDAGINMNDDALKDLYITLDIALSSIILSLESWNSTNHTEILF